MLLVLCKLELDDYDACCSKGCLICVSWLIDKMGGCDIEDEGYRGENIGYEYVVTKRYHSF